MFSYLNSITAQSWHKRMYMFILYISYFLLIITTVGIYYVNPVYLDAINHIIKYYISIFLIIRYNPFNKNNDVMTSTDKNIAFSAGCFLTITPLFISYLKTFVS